MFTPSINSKTIRWTPRSRPTGRRGRCCRIGRAADWASFGSVAGSLRLATDCGPNLDGHFAVERGIERLEDHAHAAAADVLLQDELAEPLLEHFAHFQGFSGGPWSTSVKGPRRNDGHFAVKACRSRRRIACQRVVLRRMPLGQSAQTGSSDHRGWPSRKRRNSGPTQKWPGM